MNNAGDFISYLKELAELDTEYAIEAIGGSEALYEKMLKKTIRLLPSKVEMLEEYFHADDDMKAFSVAVHGMKGSLRQLGYLQLSMQAEMLEKAAKAGDRAYCVGQIDSFREELLRFYEKTDELIRQAEPDTDSADRQKSDIRAFSQILTRAKEAAEDYDSTTAVEILLPLTKCSFGENIDQLVADAVNMLDMFKPRQALTHIAKLLEECEKV